MANIKAWSSKRGTATHYVDPEAVDANGWALCNAALRIVVGFAGGPTLTPEELKRLRATDVCDKCQHVQRKRRAEAVVANRKADAERRRRRNAAKAKA